MLILIMICSRLNPYNYSHFVLTDIFPAPSITTLSKMAGRSRLIYVDDTSPLISYQGEWDGGDTYSVNTKLGKSFNNTLHALPGSGSFTFNFAGK